MTNTLPKISGYSSIYKKATEMEKVIHDLQHKAKILFEHKQKEKPQKKDKTSGDTKAKEKKSINLLYHNTADIHLQSPTSLKKTTTGKLKKTTSVTMTNSNRKNSKAVKSATTKHSAKKKTTNDSDKPTKKESKGSSSRQSSGSRYSSTNAHFKTGNKQSKTLSPTIIKPVTNPRLKIENNKTHKSNKTSCPSVPTVFTNPIKPLHNKRASSAAGRLGPNRERNVSSTTSRSSSASSNKTKLSPTIYNNSRTLNKTLSLPINGPLTSRMTDLYTPYLIAADQLCFIREIVDRAIAQRKTFTVVGNYMVIRRALEQRGWIEKLRISYNTFDQENLRKLQAMSIPELLDKVNDKNVGPSHKRIIMSKLLARHQVDLYWDQNIEAFKYNPDKIKYTIINMIKRGGLSYSSKLGLCESLKRSHWYQIPNYASFYHPRSFSLTNNGEPDEFVKDFKLTAAISMLKWIVNVYEQPQHKLISEYGKIPVNIFHFAMTECTKLLKIKQHQDIDVLIEDASDLEWNHFLDHYYKAVHVGAHFKTNDLESEDSMAHKSKIVLEKLHEVCPYLDMDGMMNIWILKPIHGSRGIGIYICRTLQYVLKVITENKNCRYVIQKYIERPLLIYNTKFDIRQWFLISSTTPITIWIYKDCYLRFSSQTYNLKKLHESIHLTNNSVQCRYKNCTRDTAVPSYNMWDGKQFKAYLRESGFTDVFEKKIFPGMKQSFIAAILLNQEFITPRKNCFELYGADFMLTEDFQPWLIEINSRPALHASTPVTAKMCKEVLEDVIKVVIDHAQTSTSSTGLFELIHKDNIIPLPTVDLNTLKLEGEPLHTNKYLSSTTNDEKNIINREEYSQFNLKDTKNYLSYVSKEMKDSLLKLLNIIQGEKERRKQLRNKNKETNGYDRQEEKNNKESDQDNRSVTLLNDIFTQTFSEADVLSETFDGDLKKSYLNIRDEFKEIFIRSHNFDEVIYDNKDRDDELTLSDTSSSNYFTPKPSIEKLIDLYKENPKIVFKDVFNLIESIKCTNKL